MPIHLIEHSSIVHFFHSIDIKQIDCVVYQRVLAENQTYLISVGLQIKSVRLKILDNMTIEIMPENKPIVFFSGQTYVLLKPDSQGARVIGKGTLGRS